MGNGADDIVEKAVGGPMSFLGIDDILPEPPKPESTPEAPPPVTMEDPNVRQAANYRRSQLSSARKRARLLRTPQAKTTLG